MTTVHPDEEPLEEFEPLPFDDGHEEDADDDDAA